MWRCFRVFFYVSSRVGKNPKWRHPAPPATPRGEASVGSAGTRAAHPARGTGSRSVVGREGHEGHASRTFLHFVSHEETVEESVPGLPRVPTGAQASLVSSSASPRPPTPALESESPCIARLHPEDVSAIAYRVAALLREDAQPHGLIDAAEVARCRGVSRDWVYRHADELGVVRLGTGPRARLRFDPATARSANEGSVAAQAPAQPAKPSGRPRARNGHSGELLPIGPRKRGRRATR